MIKVSKHAGLLALQAHAAFLDDGSTTAYFIYYSDTKPTSLDVAANPNSALCILPLPEPCFKQVLADGIELYASTTALATKSGTAVWARLYNGNSLPYADFTIGTSDADIILNTVNIVLGSSQKLDSIILKPF